VKDLSFDALPGIASIRWPPARRAQARSAQGQPPGKIGFDGEPCVWSLDGAQRRRDAALVDNKDRWIATVDLPRAALKPVHRLSDRPGSTSTTANSAGCRTTARCGTCPRKAATRTCTRWTRPAAPAPSPRASGKRRTWPGRATAAPPGCCATARPRAPTRSAPSRPRTAHPRSQQPGWRRRGLPPVAGPAQAAGALLRPLPAAADRDPAVERRRGRQADRHPHRRLQGARLDPAAIRGGAVDPRRRPGLVQAVPPGQLEPGKSIRW
jgi:hypothetical protein